MSSDGWKVVWFGAICVVVTIVAWYATSYLATSSTPATQRVVEP
jgi:hypothetical protein